MTRRRDPAILLEGIERAGAKIKRYTQGMDFGAFLDNEQTQDAVERNFEIIGEALNSLHKISPELVERIPDTKEIIGFRHVLIHDYDHIDPNIVWASATRDLPKLLATVRELLTELDLAAESDSGPEPF